MYLEDLKVGDSVVISGNIDGGYKCQTVTKVTKTQVTVDTTRFNKRTGKRIGDADSWSRFNPSISRNWDDQQLTTWDEARKHNQTLVDQKKCYDLLIQVEQSVRNLRNCSDVKGLEFVLEVLNEVK